MTKEQQVKRLRSLREKKMVKKIIQKLKDRKTLLLFILFVVSFGFGVWGFYDEYANYRENSIDFFNAVYLTLTLFALNYSDIVHGTLLNIARFGASLFTIGSLLFIFGQGAAFIGNYFRGRFDNNSVFVFGETEEAKKLIESIGSKAVTSPESLLKAKSYVLMGNDDENLKFYDENKKKMGERPVFIKSTVFGRIMVTNKIPSWTNKLPKWPWKREKHYHHTFFSTDEIVAKTYWKEHHLLELAAQNDYKLNVAIVGFNALGEELLFQALQMNIFDTNQKINYHLWPESQFSNQAVDVEEEYLACFEATHNNLGILNIVVHHEPWYKSCDELNQMHRIIISDYQNAVPIMQKLLQVVYSKSVEVHGFHRGEIDKKIITDHSYGKVDSGHIKLIDYLSVGCDWSAIKNDKVLELAKKLNWEWSYIYTYMAMYDDKLNPKPHKLDETIIDKVIETRDIKALSVSDLATYKNLLKENITNHLLQHSDFARKRESVAEIEEKWKSYLNGKQETKYPQALYDALLEDLVKYKDKIIEQSAGNMGISSEEYLTFEEQTIEEYSKKFDDYLKKKEASGDIERQWETLSAEKRQSNYSSALYQSVREDFVIFKEKKEGIANPTLDNWEKYTDTLTELEHMRWCNYYWFLNWHFAPIEVVNKNYTKTSNPILESRKKAEERLHYDLQDFKDLFRFVQLVDVLQVRIGFGKSGLRDPECIKIVDQALTSSREKAKSMEPNR